MRDKWDTGQHHVITDTIAGSWVQQSHTPSPRDLQVLNDHEVWCGRESCYIEKEFTSQQIQQENNRYRPVTDWPYLEFYKCTNCGKGRMLEYGYGSTSRCNYCNSLAFGLVKRTTVYMSSRASGKGDSQMNDEMLVALTDFLKRN